MTCPPKKSCLTINWELTQGLLQLVALPELRELQYILAACRILERAWTLAGEPCGKYLAAVVDDAIEMIVRLRELGLLAMFSRVH